MLPLVDIQEQIILGVASGEVSREQLVEWLREHICELNENSETTRKHSQRSISATSKVLANIQKEKVLCGIQ